MTEDDLVKLIDSLLPTTSQDSPIFAYVGRTMCKELAKAWYGRQYTFSELLHLFRIGAIVGNPTGGWVVTSNPYTKQPFKAINA